MTDKYPVFDIPKDPKARAELLQRNREFCKELTAKIASRTEGDHTAIFCQEVSKMLREAREAGIYPLAHQ